jgi:uncharacterized coiled-coil protein SlyX
MRKSGKTRVRFTPERIYFSRAAAILFLLSMQAAFICVKAQTPDAEQERAASDKRLEKTAKTQTEVISDNDSSQLTPRERMLLDRIEKLERRISELEARTAAQTATEGSATIAARAKTSASSAATANVNENAQSASPQAQANSLSQEDRRALDFLRDTTFNVTLDGYYGYNFNRPVGRINLLRAYDATSDNFSLNQAAIVIEHAPDVSKNRRFGLRLDLQFGQATETLQGSAANEPRPQVYRNVFQAYGTYVAPVGKGLTVDFGKFASALGVEGNYTKDQINYSRSFYFNFLPFYHFGFRANYPFSDKFNVTYWLVNGANQSEDFNGFKSQALLFNVKPTKKINFNVNYYTGIEGRDLNPALNPGLPALPTQPGLSTDVVRPTPRGREHIFDSYITYAPTEKLTFVGEADYVINRYQPNSPPSHVAGGAGYARYQFTPKVAGAARFEYLSDRGGLFSGVTQALKEGTLTGEYKFAEGFLGRLEYRRDFSNQSFFLTNKPGLLKKEQNTATLGLVWWFGRKEGAW